MFPLPAKHGFCCGTFNLLSNFHNLMTCAATERKLLLMHLLIHSDCQLWNELEPSHKNIFMAVLVNHSPPHKCGGWEKGAIRGSNEIKRFHCRQPSLQSSLLRCVTFETEVFFASDDSGGEWWQAEMGDDSSLKAEKCQSKQSMTCQTERTCSCFQFPSD